MGKHLRIRHALLVAVLSAFGGVALAVDELEPNNPISSAQLLTISGGGGVVASIGGVAIGTGGATVNGVIGNLTGLAVQDVDFYSFQGREGDVVTIDIDGGIGGVRSVDTILTIFGPAPTYTWLRENDDAGTLDAGSTSGMDSRITNFRLPATGTYTVAVSSYPGFLTHGGVFRGTPFSPAYAFNNGDYTLVISGVTVATQQINIEIKPGSGDLAPVNPKSRGKIPVALLSSSEFNALNVDVASLTFGATGDEPSLSKCGKGGEDVNSDGLLDLVCHFENQLTHFRPGDLEGILKGRTTDNLQFEGRGLLKVVPDKRQN